MAEPELYLVVEAGAHAAGVLDACLGTAPVASVLLIPAVGEQLDARSLKPIVEQIQKKGTAALVADDWDLARVVRADGVHLTWTKEQLQRYAAAREALGGRFIVGADAGRSRDDAMTLGEEGADYVAFGIPPHVEDRDTAFARQCELLSWWSEIFEPPCVALNVATPQAAAGLAASYADFVAVSIEANLTAQQAAAKLAAYASAVQGEAVQA